MEWDYYWKRQPDGPFVTLIAVATTYLDPEADDLESLQRLVKREDDAEMRPVLMSWQVTRAGGLLRPPRGLRSLPRCRL